MTTPADLPECVEVVVTAEDASWLARFTRALVDDHLVAWGHNIAPIRAIYRWQGTVYDETQARVGLHTRATLVPAIVARADRDHPDDVPCVIAMPVVDGTSSTFVGSWRRRRRPSPQHPPSRSPRCHRTRHALLCIRSPACLAATADRGIARTRALRWPPVVVSGMASTWAVTNAHAPVRLHDLNLERVSGRQRVRAAG